MLMLDVAAAGVANTKHNLGASANANYVVGDNRFDGTTEICVFCHTPHGANVSISAPAPLWNRNFTTTAYTTYASLGSTTRDGEVATTGSVSIACLSCHDGTQSMDIMINTPGSGTDPSPTGFPASGTWSGTNQTAGKITGAFTNLGVDLTNDHPIGIQYCGGGINIGTPDGPCVNDPDFKLAPNLQHSGAGAGTRWWVETNGNTTREITDLPLYTRTDTTTYDSLPLNGGAQPFVECASCHDPHTNNTTFLRVSNSSSVICLACHTK
ncbi:MAG: hypothetical protein A2V79_05735 [Betaproteobacteria bacterium RBG_16_56_24]|nr:MAG: hypothetical protein A2V79_05735 [Betaproteobacteria bacterium RBG_16_56_24]